MAIVRFTDPFAGLTNMHSQLDDMFSNFFGNMPSAQNGRVSPDVKERLNPTQFRRD